MRIAIALGLGYWFLFVPGLAQAIFRVKEVCSLWYESEAAIRKASSRIGSGLSMSFTEKQDYVSNAGRRSDTTASLL